MGSRGNAEYMGSRFTGSDSPSNSHSFNFNMEAIKKKMQAMKVEKDNACDQADVSEEKMKAARIRAQKGEDEVEELVIKSRQLETELDVTSERLSIATLQLEEKEKQLAATELEMNALTRSLCSSCRRRWTGLRMSLWQSRRSTRRSLKSSSRPSLRCPDTKMSKCHILAKIYLDTLH